MSDSKQSKAPAQPVTKPTQPAPLPQPSNGILANDGALKNNK